MNKTDKNIIEIINNLIKLSNDLKDMSSEKDSIITKLICGHDVVQIRSDYWVKRTSDGHYVEMTTEEQLEYSK